ncbi:MAG: DUF1963 domain-containing protein [Lysobacterales bacterium]
MTLQETILDLGDGWRLLLTLDARDPSEKAPLDPDWCYATLVTPDGVRNDVMPLVSIPIPADKQAEKSERASAAALRQFAEQVRGKPGEAHYHEMANSAEAKAQALSRESIRLPFRAQSLGGGHALLSFHVRRGPITFRVVDLRAAVVVQETDASILAKAIEQSPRGVHSSEFRAAVLRQSEDRKINLTAADLAQASGVINRKIKVLAAGNGSWLVDCGFARALLTQTKGKWSLANFWPSVGNFWPTAAATESGFAFIAGNGASDEVLHVNGEDGSTIDRWPVKARATVATMAGRLPPGPSFVLASLGARPKLYTQGVNQGLDLPGLVSVDKYEYAEVAVSPDAAVVGVRKFFGGTTLALFRPDSGTAAYLPSPSYMTRDTALGKQIRTPGFALTERGLETIADGFHQVRALNEMDWRTPLPPPSPIRRYKLPAETLSAALKTKPLSDVSDQIRSWYRPSLLLKPKRSKSDNLALGSSKSGGRPDLPKGSAWPRWRGSPMAFLLQLNLAEVNATDPEMGLPSSGLLSAFLAFDMDYPMPSFYGEANQDRAGCKVIYTPAEIELDRLEMPADVPKEHHAAQGKVCAYTMTMGGPRLPDLSNDRVQRAQLTTQQAESYLALVAAINGDDEARVNWGTRLGGYSALIQDDTIHLHAESLDRGITADSAEFGKLWPEDRYQSQSERWRQLLQLAEGPEGWTWGDAGLMHLMVLSEQWSVGQFDPVWSIGAC